MTNDEYRQNMDLIVGQVRVLNEMPVQQMLDDLDWIESMGPMLDPTAMMQPGTFDRIRDQKRLLQAVRDLQTVAAQIMETSA